MGDFHIAILETSAPALPSSVEEGREGRKEGGMGAGRKRGKYFHQRKG